MKERTLAEMKKQYEALGAEIAQREKAEAEEREVRLIAEKAVRKEKVELAEKEYIKLRTAYIKDYGTYISTESYESDHIPSLLHMFL